MADSARRWLVRGRVQGVGFRRFVEREAVSLGLAGWVRNLADGRVEAFAQGPGPSLDALQGRLWQGPRWSEVREVEAMEEAPAAASTSFQIR
ncbi:MAG TPA: acylphosphatase [Bryobacteraceae bacterium]|nr:acylphosphatase [Bryobacteraceae bacterium]